MHDLIHGNAAFLAVWVLSSMAILALALLAERRIRASAATKHVLIFGAMLAPVVLLAAVVLRSAIPAGRGGVPSAPAVVAGWAVADDGRAPAASRDFVCALGALWAAGTALALLRTARETQRWREARRRAVPVSDRAMPVDHPVEVSDACREPAVAGILDPTILLPAGAYLDALSDDELATVLEHELEHVRRRDNLRALVVQIACTFFWFSPVHRAARRRLVELRESACDAAVLARGCQPESYLSALAKSCQSSFQSSAVASMSRLHLRERMESIMSFEPQPFRRLSWAARVALIAVAGLALTAFALLAPSPYLHASTPGQFSADVSVRAGTEGRYVATIRFDAPDGAFTTVAVMQSLPDVRTVTSTHGGRTYKVVVNTNADASGTAEVEVREGDDVVWTTTRVFRAPVPVAPEPAPEAGGYTRVKPGMTPPRIIDRVEPVYPAAAKAERIAGVVIADMLISEQGMIEGVHILKGLGHGIDEATVDALKQWRFEPAMSDGKPVPVIFNVTLNYRLPE